MRSLVPLQSRLSGLRQDRLSVGYPQPALERRGVFEGGGRVWRADGSGDPLVLEGHEDDVGHGAWSPGGRQIVTVSWDNNPEFQIDEAQQVSSAGMGTGSITLKELIPSIPH